MMNYFRKYAAPLIVVTGLAFFIWLVVDLSGVTGGGGGVTSATSAGSVNGQSIDARSYEQAVQNATEQRQRQATGSLGIDDIAQIRQDVWNQFVDQAVLETEYQRRHISASSTEIATAIQESPPQELQQTPDFQTNGRFDITKYHRWLQSPGAAPYLGVLEERYRDEVLRSKLLRQVTGDVIVPDQAVWQQFRDAHETVTMNVTAVIARNAVPDSAVPVTTAEAEAYYHAHLSTFERPAGAFLSFVSIPRGPDRTDTLAALSRAQAIHNELIKGAPFAEVARRESADSASGAKGGDLGEWTRGKMTPPFDAAAFTLPIGKVSDPVLTEFGYHIIQITKRTGDKATGRHILIPIELAGPHRDLVDARADSIERLAGDRVDGPALDSAARIMGLRVGRAGPIQKGTQLQLGVNVIPDASTWAFQTLKPGSIGSLVETDDALYLFRIDSIRGSGTPPFAEVRVAAETQVRDAKRLDAARRIGADLSKRLSEGSSLQQATAALHLPFRSMGPFTRTSPPIGNPLVVGTAFSLAVGQRSPLLDTPDGIYLFEITARTPADSTAFQKQLGDLQVKAIQRARQDRVRSYLLALHTNAKIKDNREKLFQAAAQPALDQGL
ncbi:MAG: SurA N-terminal domain-containing protein [Gemmatimonadales bacterium]